MKLLLKKKPQKVETSVRKPVLIKKAKPQITLVKPLVPKKPKPQEELPADEYKNIGITKTLHINTNDKGAEFNVTISVNRAGDEGLPILDIREFIKSAKYTGFTKKGVVIPLELAKDFMGMLADVLNDVDVKKALRDLEL